MQEEFCYALSRLSPVPIGDDQMATLVRKLDANNDGLISIDEWVTFSLKGFEEEAVRGLEAPVPFH